MKNTVAFLLAIVGVYALSFALDLLLGGILRVYPNTAFLPVVTWSVVAAVTLLLALRLTDLRRWLAIPFLAFGLLTAVGGAVGHRYSLGVAALMFVQAAVLWLACQPERA